MRKIVTYICTGHVIKKHGLTAQRNFPALNDKKYITLTHLLQTFMEIKAANCLRLVDQTLKCFYVQSNGWVDEGGPLYFRS